MSKTLKNYDIVMVPDPVLRAKAQEVARVDDEIKNQMQRMLQTMYDAPGIGLAAIQVAVPRRLVVVARCVPCSVCAAAASMSARLSAERVTASTARTSLPSTRIAGMP